MWSRIIAISLVLVMVFSAFLILGTPARASPPSIMPRAVPDYMKYITINNFKFDPLAQTPSIPASLRYDTVPRDQQFYYIVQFNGPVTPAMKTMLASTGVTILQYIAYNAFVVRADGPAIDRAAALPVVRWTGVFEPAYKLSPRLSDEFGLIAQRAMERARDGDSLDGGAVTAVGADGMSAKSVRVSDGSAASASSFSAKFDPSASGSTMASQPSFGGAAAAPSSGTGLRISLEITAFERSRVPEIVGAASALGGTHITYSLGNSGSVRVEVDKGALALLARVTGVLYVDRFVQPYISNDLARWVVQSGDTDTFATPIHDHGIHGTGQTVTLGDTGIDYNHPAFWDPVNKTPGPDARKLTDYYPACTDNCDDTDNGGNHGTHTSGSVGGDDGTWHVYDGDATGSNGTTGPHDGQAFDAWIQMTDMSNDGFFVYFDTITDVWQRAVDRDSWIHSDSWGSVDFQAEYIQEAADTDDFIWNNQDFLVVFAAANAGSGLRSMNLFGVAKNVVTVGATVNGLGLESVAGFSSRGPTQDGRIKPDVMAPGQSVWSALGQDPNGDGTTYVQYQGTSMATPTVAGSAALVRQYYMDGWYPTGAPNPGDGFTPSAALLKATMINSAREMTGTGAYGNSESYYPNDNQGFGRLTLDDALAFQGETRGLVVDDDRIGLNTGDVVNYDLAIGDPSESVEITLVWSDYPGTAGCNPCLVNDLDLTVTAPDGTLYAGNQYAGMNPGESEPNPSGSDHLNNVESVLVITGVQAGLWIVTVTANDVPNGAQPYAVVMAGGLATQRGIIQMDRHNYQSSATVNIKVVDTGLNVDPLAPDTVDINMTSTTETTPEVVTLTETGNATSVFAGSIQLVLGASGVPDGQLQVTDGDTITAEYIDADDGQGGVDVHVYDTATVDDTAPAISDVAATDLRFNGATIEWATDEPASSAVHYAVAPGPPGSTVSEERLVTSHSIVLSDLLENTSYVFSVESTDDAGNTALDDNATNYYRFVTPPKPPTAPPSVEWPTYHNNLPRQGVSPSNFQPPLNREWDDGPYLLQFWNGPIMAEGMLFSAPLDGVLRARDPFTGEVLWESALGGQYYYTGTMAANDGVLYANFYDSSGGTAYAIDMYTGETIWAVSDESGLDFNARIPIAYADGLVLGTDWSGKAYALNAADGTVEWTFDMDGYSLVTGAAVSAGLAYFTSIGGTVYALDEFSGALVWSHSIGNTVTTTPLFAQGNIYVGDYSGRETALDASTGDVVWQKGGFSLIDVSTPAYDGSSIYFGTFGNQYVGLDATDGTVLWRTSIGGPVGTSPAYANGYVYGSSWDGRLYTFDADDGSIVDQETLISFGSTSFPAVSDGWVWLEDYNGNIFGFFGQLPVGVRVTPSRQSQDAVPDSEVDHRVTVKNIGFSGPDTFDAVVTLGALGWTTELFQADGVTRLVDTDADGIPDTGSLDTNESVDVIIRVTVPADVLPGDSETASVRFTSSNDLTRSKVAEVTTTVPPPGVSVGPRAYFTPNPGDTVRAEMEVRNKGGFPDTIDVVAVSSLDWAVRLYEADGTTPLSDSDGDGIPDVGLVPGLQAVTIVVENDVPADTPEDTLQRVAVTGTSSLNESVNGTAYLVVELIPPPDQQWPTFHNNNRRHGESPSPHEPPISELWRSGSQTLSLWTGPVVADNILYGTSMDGYLRARDPFSGEVLWEKHLGDTYYYTGAPTVKDGVVYATFYGYYAGDPDPFCPRDPPFYLSCGYVYAFDAETGNEIWRVGPNETHLNFNARVAMAYTDGLVIGAAWNDFIDGQVYALDAEDGHLVWLFNGDGLPYGGAATSGRIVYYGTTSGWMYALNDQTGNLVWASRLGGTITSVPLVAQGMVLVGTSSGTMYALDALTGSTIWSTGGFTAIYFSTPATDGFAIYFGTDGSQYVALELGTGTVLWRTSIGGPVESSVAFANGFVYGTAWDGRFRTLNATTGQIVDTEVLGTFASTSSPAIQRGWIWIDDYLGAMYAFGGDGAGELRELVVNPAQANVEVGKALLFTAHGLDAFDNPIPAGVVTWDTGLPGSGGLGTIFPIDDHTAFYIAGTIAGEDLLEATAGEYRGTASVNVLPGDLERIQVAMLVGGNRLDGPVSIPAGSQRTFVATATDRYGNAISGAAITWAVEGGIGRFNSGGVFTADTRVGVGFVNATSGGEVGRQQVTIVPATPARVDIDVLSTSLAVDSQSLIVATVRDAYGNANPDGVVKWTTGLGTPLPLTSDGRAILYRAPITTTPGSVQLTAGIDVDDDGVVDVSRTTTLTIVAGPPVGISIDAPATTVAVGGTLDFGAVVTDQFGNAVTGRTIGWETTAGSINQQGVFTAPSNPGLVVITASTAGRESFVVIEVTSGGFEQFSRQATSATSLTLLVATIVAVTASVFLFVRYRESKRELEEIRRGRGGGGAGGEV